MQVSYRRLRQNELDHELIWFAVSLGSLTLAVLWFWVGLPWPQCLFHAVTGRPCLTCGATRATMQFLHGHLAAAFRWNPLVFVTLCGLTVFDIYAGTVLTFRTARIRIDGVSDAQRKVVRYAVIITLALNWIYLLSRPAGTF